MQGNFSHYIYITRMYFFRICSTAMNRIRMKIHGVTLGKQANFIGKTRIYRKKNSKIIIGAHCEFLSHGHSNLIGIDRNCSFSTLTTQAEIHIGDRCGFSGTVIGCFSMVHIGDDVKCGANTLITDSDWHSEDPRSGSVKPIVIGKNVWLGESVRVLKGVTIGENSVIGAGSIVTKDIPANVVAAGNPCIIIKKLADEQ